MLARPNRVITGEEFRAAVRRGRRTSTPSAVFHIVDRPGSPARFGIIASRAVGGAVDRNRLRRRLRAICRELVDEGAAGHDVVIRALPGSASLPWDALRELVRGALSPRVVAA